MKLFYLKSFLIVGLLFIFVTASSADPAATQLLSLGRMNDAVSILSSRADAESLNQLSRAYFAMEQWDEAVRYGERAASLDPNNATYHLWLGREYGRKAADANPLIAGDWLARRRTNSSALYNSILPMWRRASIWRSITPRLRRSWVADWIRPAIRLRRCRSTIRPSRI